jgi:hypothetical protein
MIKAPSPHNDTTRRYSRTLQQAFPSCPSWGESKPPLADRVMMYACAFATGFLTALIVFG